jgi:hypothetical protein
MRKTVYLVVIDGAGEYRDSYDVLKIAADSPQAAVDYAISKGMGYGQETDGKAFVVPYATVSSFAITPTSKKVASPSTSPLQDLPRQEAK